MVSSAPPATKRDWFSVGQAADLTGADRRDIREALQSGTLIGYRRAWPLRLAWAPKWRVHRTDLDAWDRTG